MKTLHSFRNTALLLLIVCLSACGEQSQAPAREAAPAQEPVDPPKGLISLDEARTDFRMYSERRVPLIRHYEDSIFKQQGVDSAFAVARYVAFDYADLQQYMKYIEQRATEAGTDIKSLRIYFSNNPDQEKFVHPRQNSVFLLPAVQPDARRPEQYGLYINDDGTPAYLTLDLQFWNGEGMGLREKGDQPAAASLLPIPTMATFANGSLILNEGGSSPPPNN